MSPKLRFRGFDSEWKPTRLADELIEYKLGGNYPNSEKVTKHPLIKMGNLGRGVMNLRKVEYIEEGTTIDPSDEIKDSDLFFNTRNTLELVGKVAIWRSELPKAYYNSNLMRLTFACNQFMNYRLNSVDAVEALRRLATGTTSVAAIYTRDLLQMEVTIPSLPEQRKIADFLTVVDERIAHLSHKKVLLEAYKKGVMQQIFTQAIRFQDNNGNDFPDWEEKRLGDVVTVNPKASNLPDSFIYIDLESVNAGVLHSPRRIAKEDAPSRAQRLLQRGDILYQTVRPYQMNNFMFDLSGVHVASTGYAQLRASKSDARFIYHSLHLPRFVGDVMDRCTGTSYPAINSKDLAEIEISVPSLSEQIKIANFLTAIDHKIEAVAAQITLTQTWKKGLLQQMFV